MKDFTFRFVNPDKPIWYFLVQNPDRSGNPNWHHYYTVISNSSDIPKERIREGNTLTNGHKVVARVTSEEAILALQQHNTNIHMTEWMGQDKKWPVHENWH